MSINKKNPYDVEVHIAEIYDNLVTESHDVNFIIELLSQFKCNNILEPFCGTGRILLPIAEKGFSVTGIDGSGVMLNQLHNKIRDKFLNISNRIKIIKADVTEYSWGTGYDAIILGANCFFELATLEEQEKVLKKAYNSVREGGYIFIDNDNIENELPDSWCKVNTENESFPSGICQDGAELRAYLKPIYVNKAKKIWKAQRRLEVYKDSKITEEYTWEQQKHPIGYSEIMNMVNKLNLSVINVWSGTNERKSFTPGSNRATFWLQR